MSWTSQDRRICMKSFELNSTISASTYKVGQGLFCCLRSVEFGHCPKCIFVGVINQSHLRIYSFPFQREKHDYLSPVGKGLQNDSRTEKTMSLYPIRNYEKALQGVYSTSFRVLRAFPLRNCKGPDEANGRRRFLYNGNIIAELSRAKRAAEHHG